MSTTVNRASVVLTGPAAPMNLVVLTDGNSPSGVSLPGAGTSLVVADAVALSGGTVVLTMPWSALVIGTAIRIDSVSTGLAVQALPPGVSLQVSPIAGTFGLTRPFFGAQGSFGAVASANAANIGGPALGGQGGFRAVLS